MYRSRTMKHGKMHIRNLLWLTGFITLLVSCEKAAVYDNPNPPVIQSLSPDNGPAGTSVYINGENFSPRIPDNTVMIGSTEINVYKADSNYLVIIIPIGLKTGAVKVTVNDKSVTGPVFTYEPTVTVLSYAGNGLIGLQDGSLTEARFNLPRAMALDADGNMYVADQANNVIRKITVDGQVTTLVGNGEAGSMDGSDSSARFNQPGALIVGKDGNIYVADYAGNAIRKVTPQGEVTTIAGDSIHGNVNGDGTIARFYGPSGITMDDQGNFYVTDFLNNQIKKITPGYQVSLYAGTGAVGTNDGDRLQSTFFGPTTITTDNDGNMYVGDWFNFRVRKIDPSGMVTTLAGSTSGYTDGMASSAQFNTPVGLAADDQGNLYVADGFNNVIRKVDSDGNVTTFAGTTSPGYKNGNPADALFNGPVGLLYDTNANTLYVADWYNYRIRKITIR
jgi:sugar lactone lactonase YvrE